MVAVHLWKIFYPLPARKPCRFSQEIHFRSFFLCVCPVRAVLTSLFGVFQQQCCGGESPRDYLNSFWFITNTERGTRSFVPPSCCRQSQMGRAWAPAPIDPMCTTYAYDSQAFASSVHNVVSAEVANSVLETLGPMGGVFRLLWLLLDSAHRI